MSYQQLFTVINTRTNDELTCYGYRANSFKSAVFYALSFLTLGILNLVVHWKPLWKVKLTKSWCSLEDCDTVILKDMNSDVYVEKIINHQSHEVPTTKERLIDERSKGQTRYFEHKCLRYIWEEEQYNFVPLRGLQPKCLELLENYHGISESKKDEMLETYGLNTIEVKVKSYWNLLITEVLNPFYVFQLLSITLWCTDEYYYYAGCIFFVSCVSIGVSLYETRKQSQTLHDMVASQLVPTVTVWRKGEDCKDVPSFEVVPGDLIVIPEKGTLMCCDAVLIAGNCIVNESMLTGESVPVTKTPLTVQDENETYSPEEHRRHTLYCGTDIVQTRYYGHSKVLAVVVRTGFLTSKGELIQSIMFPKPIGFTFYRDAIKFIIILFVMACFGMAYSIYIYVSRHSSIKLILLRGLDIFTIVVPPSLPAAMTVGTVYAQSRMKKKGIFCISPPRINVSGKIKIVCFDKTGTLTEDGLDLYGVLPVVNTEFGNVLREPSSLPTHHKFLAAMSSCHSLTLLDGELTGDPLDIKMFEATQWLLTEPGKDSSKYDSLAPSVVKPIRDSYYLGDSEDQVPYEIGIVRQFTFSSSLQRMSVIVRCLGSEHMDVYVKGAPEKISSLCVATSLPQNFSSLLHQYSIQGFRIIALAHKPLSTRVTWHQAQRIKRNVVESDLTFLGLLLMQNALKKETKPVVKLLHDADLRTVMVTGDNMLTAVSVARDCQMIPPTDDILYLKAFPGDGHKSSYVEWNFEASGTNSDETEGYSNGGMLNSVSKAQDGTYHVIVDGKSFAVLRSDFHDHYQNLLVKGKVFARMAPEQKTQLIEDLQELNYIVGMCGDGANDCGALKAAHVGISLSEAEASVAAPFTSKIPNIQCVPEVIKEGRCALVTSFGVFKYMALYSMIQFISILILYTEGSILGDMMFLYIDLCITTTVAVLMGLTGPYNKLVKRRPLGSLVSFVTISSVVLQIVICLAFQLFSLIFLQSQTWYTKSKILRQDQLFTWEGSVIFCVSAFQYITLAIVYSKGPPFRQPLYKNTYFFVALILLIGFTTFLTFDSVKAVSHFFQLKRDVHLNFKLYLMCIVITNFIISLIIEAVISSQMFKKMSSAIKRKKKPKNLYKRLEMELSSHTDWLSTNDVPYSPSIS